MNALTVIEPPHLGQIKGSNSYTRFIQRAQVWEAGFFGSRSFSGATSRSKEAAKERSFPRRQRVKMKRVKMGVEI